jgi:hypothetical protein
MIASAGIVQGQTRYGLHRFGVGTDPLRIFGNALENDTYLTMQAEFYPALETRYRYAYLFGEISYYSNTGSSVHGFQLKAGAFPYIKERKVYFRLIPAAGFGVYEVENAPCHTLSMSVRSMLGVQLTRAASLRFILDLGYSIGGFSSVYPTAYHIFGTGYLISFSPIAPILEPGLQAVYHFSAGLR